MTKISRFTELFSLRSFVLKFNIFSLICLRLFVPVVWSLTFIAFTVVYKTMIVRTVVIVKGVI